MDKKQYTKPKLEVVNLDYSISLQMQSQPSDPPPRGSAPRQQQDETFPSPFKNDSPFG